MVSVHTHTIRRAGKRDVLVIGAGLHGLVTAKVLLNDSNLFFESVTVFEKNSTLGGVWSSDRIYEGLTTNSPLLTYEIPGFPFPEHVRHSGAHAEAEDVSQYFQSYAERYSVAECIQYQTLVTDLSWDTSCSAWAVKGRLANDEFLAYFDYVVICVGLYHTGFNALTSPQISQFSGYTYHSSEVGRPEVRNDLANSRRVLILGAGKSALDLAAILAKGKWRNDERNTEVTLLYRRPHWLSPRRMVRRTIPVEKLLFSRFVGAWLPFAKHPDLLHRLIAETALGRWSTKQVFRLISDDFIKSNNQQGLPQTLPRHSFAQALSGALHVEPPGFLDCVRSGRINIVTGIINSLVDKTVKVETEGQELLTIDADNILQATGYTLALPFLSDATLQTLRLLQPGEVIRSKTDLPYIRLYRLIVPPGTTDITKGSYRRIAFNGFAYSLLNPTVAHVTANWISDYFSGAVDIPEPAVVEEEINSFRAWQSRSFGAHGVKGVHIGPHATLYTDLLLADMGLQSGHVTDGIPGPIRTCREWFRPMYPEIYAGVALDRKARDMDRSNHKGEIFKNERQSVFIEGAVLLKWILLSIIRYLLTGAL